MNSRSHDPLINRFLNACSRAAQDRLASGGSTDVFVNMLIYRLGHLVISTPSRGRTMKLVEWLLRRLQKLISFYVYHLEIPFEAKIGAGVRMPHPHNIVLNSRVIVGDNCVIYHNITIGTTTESQHKNKAPTLGHGVEIGTGAILIGDIKVGHGATIGAGAVVTKDIPAGSTVLGHNKIRTSVG